MWGLNPQLRNQESHASQVSQERNIDPHGTILLKPAKQSSRNFWILRQNIPNL